MSSDRGWNMPYQKYIEAGYFKTEQSSYIDQSTKLEYISYKTVVFQKGIQFIIRRLSDNGFSSENNQLRIAA